MEQDTSTKSSGSDSSDYPLTKSPAELHKYWQEQIQAAEKRLDDFRRNGDKVYSRYLCDGDEDSKVDMAARLNLYYNTVNTMKSALYGSTPRPEVTREHHDPDDDVARVACLMYQRMLELDIRSPGDDLSSTLNYALLDRLVPGMGTGRVRLVTKGGSKYVKIEYVHWKDFLWGWGRTWPEVPWTAFRAYMAKDEVKRRWSKKVAEKLKYKAMKKADEGSDSEDEKSSKVQKAEIWEIWCKKTRRVYWWSEGADLIIDSIEDPYGLKGFYPTTKPMAANCTTQLFIPKSDYHFVEDLYVQADLLTERISVITEAVKVVGVYDASQPEIGRMLTEGCENDLIPVEKWAMLAEKGGLKGVVDWFPVQDVVGVLQTLREVLNDVVSQIYQLTGLGDILRGQESSPYTGEGTQRLKAKFGSLRIQALQDEFAHFASDLSELKVELIGNLLPPQDIVKLSAATYLPEPDRQYINPALQLIMSGSSRWRVNIRPESLAMVDYAELRIERSEFLNAMATYIQSAQAAVQSMPGSLPVMLELLKWGMSGYKGANVLEGIMDQAIDQARNNPPQTDNGKAQEQAQSHQMEMQKLQMKHQNDTQLQQMKFNNQMQQMQAEHQNAMRELAAKSNADLRKISSDLQADLRTIAEELRSDLMVERSQAENAAAESQVDHENTVVEKTVEHEYTLEEMEENAKMASRQRDGQADSD